MPRKACDVCYRKRIKCDGQKPRCSNCVLYSIDCTSEAASRKARPRKPKKKVAGEDVEALQARVASLESSLAGALQKINDLQNKDVEDIVSAPFVPGTDADQLKNDHAQEDLPSLQETLPAVERYLRSLNAILPLFHPERLLQLISDWYSCPGTRDTTKWAAINVVLALASRESCYQQMTPSNNITNYIRNAQSVLTEIITTETTLLSVQIVVGMALLFQGIQDLKPATVLIAIALRLAHDLGLHTEFGSEQLSQSIIRERNRVFWIAYILDRDISLRTRKPPVQRDADIQIPWPSAEPAHDWAGFLVAADGSSSFNFLEARVRLAQIQGDVYHAMHSSSALSQHGTHRLDNVATIGHKLDDWMAKVPQSFQPDAIATNGESNSLRSFGVLYASHFACRVCVSQAHIMETPWLRSLQSFGATSVRDGMIVPAPRPQGWNKLVGEARQYLKLFNSVKHKDPAFVWMTACTYVSGAIILTANNMFSPQHEMAGSDENEIDVASSFLNNFVEQAPFEALKTTRDAWEELKGYAHAARSQSALQVR